METCGATRAALQIEIANLADAIASGQLKSSPALADWLARAEPEFAGLQHGDAPRAAVAVLPRAMDRFQALVADLGRLA